MVTLTYLPPAERRWVTREEGSRTPTTRSTQLVMEATKSSPPEPIALKVRSAGYAFT